MRLGSVAEPLNKEELLQQETGLPSIFSFPSPHIFVHFNVWALDKDYF
ncbi:hypothetical protein EH2_00773 [Bacillus subtilis]|nr:hypothetical protein EH2_00773 [Bacillus subtilis]